MWLVPMRLYEGMVNTACLVRATRNIAANVVIAIFLSQELVTFPLPCRAVLPSYHSVFFVLFNTARGTRPMDF